VDPHALTPLAFAALLIWVMYRRVRRSFGPQPVRRRALMFRAGLFTVLAALILIFSPHSPELMGTVLGGILAGLLLGYVGLRHTRFETTDKGRVYIPHTYIGLFVTSLLIIRLAIRYVPIYMNSQPYPASDDPWAAYQRNPLTLAVFGLVVGYYVFYNIGILRRSADPALATTQAPPA
jgi:hypothetical protein